MVEIDAVTFTVLTLCMSSPHTIVSLGMHILETHSSTLESRPSQFSEQRKTTTQNQHVELSTNWTWFIELTYLMPSAFPHAHRRNVCTAYTILSKYICTGTFQMTLRACTVSKRSALYTPGKSVKEQIQAAQSSFLPFSSMLELPAFSQRPWLFQLLPCSHLFLLLDSKPDSHIPQWVMSVQSKNSQNSFASYKSVVLWQLQTRVCNCRKSQGGYPSPALPPWNTCTPEKLSISSIVAQNFRNIIFANYYTVRWTFVSGTELDVRLSPRLSTMDDFWPSSRTV